jgi:class 3 adenylate cyclase
VRDGRLALLPVERALSNDVRIGSAELARLRGLDLAFVLSVRRALGLPDADPEEPVFREADVETFRELGNVRREARLADDGMLEVLGVVGRSLWKISETTLAVVDEAVSGSSVNECDLAMRYAQVALQLGTVAGPLLESAMHAHLREGLREEVVTTEELRSGIDDTWTVTVCFVDLVGFTGLGEQLTAEGAHALARGLTRIAASVASPPVRLVKMMGDGAMLVSTEARPLIDAALEMVARGAEDALLIAILWVLSPIDLLPEFLPVIGPLDDVVAVILLLRYAARATPRDVLLAAWPAEPRLLERLLPTVG